MSVQVKPRRYGRRHESVEAVRVTKENMDSVAEWCGGYVSQRGWVAFSDPHGRDASVEAGEWLVKSSAGFDSVAEPDFAADYTAEADEFAPDWAVSPFDMLDDWAEENGVREETARDLIGWTPEKFADFKAGYLRLDEADADRIAEATGTPAYMWLRFDRSWRPVVSMVRQRDRARATAVDLEQRLAEVERIARGWLTLYEHCATGVGAAKADAAEQILDVINADHGGDERG